MRQFQPPIIYVDEQMTEHPRYAKVCTLLPDAEVIVYRDEIPSRRNLVSPPALILPVRKGRAVKTWFHHPSLVGGLEHYIILTQNCHFDCDYCYLQGYFDYHDVHLFLDVETIIAELELLYHQHREHLNVTTGEFGDSLALDHLTGFTVTLLDYAARREGLRLELRTKTNVIAPLLTRTAIPNIRISYSLNPENLIQRYEHGTASLIERLRAAARLQQAGYGIAIRFDPMFCYEGDKEDYSQLIRQVAKVLDFGKIKAIIIGTFRFLPKFKTTLATEKRQTGIFQHEFVLCRDGKMRYFKKYRIALYEHVIKEIMRYTHNPPSITFCMEPPEIWDVSGLSCSSGV